LRTSNKQVFGRKFRTVFS